MALRRHRVRLRGRYVRYRFVAAARTSWSIGRRLAYVALGVWLAQAGYRQWDTSPWFRVQRVTVDPSAPAGLAERFPVSPGDHLFRFSGMGLQALIQKEFPELSDVRVRRDLKRGVSVSVAWRSPVARMSDDGETWRGIDAAGGVFPLERFAGRPDGPALDKLPILVGAPEGPRVKPLLEFLAVMRNLDVAWAKTIRKVKAEPTGETVLFIDQGTPVYWGEMERESGPRRIKAARLEKVLRHNLLSTGVEYIRFVSDDRIAVKLASSAASPSLQN